MSSMTQLIAAVRENSAAVGRMSTYGNVNENLPVLTPFTGDQMLILIKEIKRNTAIIEETEDYRINNFREMTTERCRATTIVNGTIVCDWGLSGVVAAAANVVGSLTVTSS